MSNMIDMTDHTSKKKCGHIRNTWNMKFDLMHINRKWKHMRTMHVCYVCMEHAWPDVNFHIVNDDHIIKPPSSALQNQCFNYVYIYTVYRLTFGSLMRIKLCWNGSTIVVNNSSSTCKPTQQLKGFKHNKTPSSDECWVLVRHKQAHIVRLKNYLKYKSVASCHFGWKFGENVLCISF